MRNLLPFRRWPFFGRDREAAEKLWAYHLSFWQETGSVQMPVEVAAGSGADPALLEAERDAGRRLAGRFEVETREELDAWTDAFAGSHARLLGALADLGGSWQQEYLVHLARGFFLTRTLLFLREDLRAQRLFIPREELRRMDVEVEEFFAEEASEPVRRLLWRQRVRAQDELARGQNVIGEAGWMGRRVLRFWWLIASEALSELDRRDYEPGEVRPAWWRRTAVTLQAVSGGGRVRSD